MKIRDSGWPRLVAMIDAHERAGNLRLLPEPKLCEEIGVTRARLRGLLKRAEGEGLIWRHVGKGTFVGARPIVRDDAAQRLSVSADDLFDARALIEPRLAAQAALHATSKDVAAMESIQSEMLATQSFQDWRRLDSRLHRLIALATHNPLLVLVYDTLHTPIRLELDARLEEVFSQPLAPRAETNGEHGEMIRAIASHRPDVAQEIMLGHILSVRDRLFGAS